MQLREAFLHIWLWLTSYVTVVTNIIMFLCSSDDLFSKYANHQLFVFEIALCLLLEFKNR